MSGYQDVRFRLRLRAPLGSPMQADTVFGHLVWAVARTEGPDGAATFLEPFIAGAPPFVLSDAFPAGLLPRPLLPAGPFTGRDILGRADHARIKKISKAPFVTVPDFLKVAADPGHTPDPVGSPWKPVKTPHAAIDRNTWTTTPGGQFFETESWVIDGRDPELDLYVRAVDGWVDRVEDLLRMVARTGFGRDRSIGLGAFEVTGREEVTLTPDASEAADGFISLSSWVPAAADPTEGRWRIRVKRGFLGENAGGGNPFKRPLIQLEPGAAMRTGSSPAPWYGRIVRDIAPGMPEAVQYGFALAVPCRWR